ncbi:MAG: hypothetical protein KF729_09935, partial [Sandaracinaceae bacterium]|nr:hypothetical protein [Sandaracinaceae bacterium]
SPAWTGAPPSLAEPARRDGDERPTERGIPLFSDEELGLEGGSAAWFDAGVGFDEASTEYRPVAIPPPEPGDDEVPRTVVMRPDQLPGAPAASQPALAAPARDGSIALWLAIGALALFAVAGTALLVIAFAT